MRGWIKDNSGFIILNILITLLFILTGLGIYQSLLRNDENYFMSFSSLIFAALAVVYTIYVQAKQERSSKKEKLALRTAIVKKSIHQDDLEKEINQLYKYYRGKSIEFHVVNTSIGQNDNRKDIIIIYH